MIRRWQEGPAGVGVTFWLFRNLAAGVAASIRIFRNLAAAVAVRIRCSQVITAGVFEDESELEHEAIEICDGESYVYSFD